LKRSLRPLIFLIVLAGLLYSVWFVFRSGESGKPSVESVASGQSGTVNLISWNLFNFGKSKSPEDIAFIAETLRDADVVAVQEVSTGLAGAKAVAALSDELNRKGAKWDYVVSDATTGEGTERYAFLWKTHRLKLKGKPFLIPELASKIDREPFLARFESNGKTFSVVSFHAIPTSKKPQTETSKLDDVVSAYPNDNLIFVGDFNLSESHEGFDDLKEAGFQPSFIKTKTSLKMKKSDGEHLANEYDNLFFHPQKIKKARAGAIDFSLKFNSLDKARDISDHLPVKLEFMVN